MSDETIKRWLNRASTWAGGMAVGLMATGHPTAALWAVIVAALILDLRLEILP